MTRDHKLFLNWLLTFSLIFFFFYILYDNNIIQHLLSADRSYITTIIFSAFFIISMHCGFYTFLVSCELNKAHIIKKNLLKDDVKLRLIDDHLILSSKGEMSDGIVSQYFKDLINLKKNKNFPVIILRLYQTFGSNQDLNRLIPFVINSCISKKKFPYAINK